MQIYFKPIKEEDFVKIKVLYDYYIESSTATFHTEPITIQELQDSIYIDHAVYKSFGIYHEDEFIGFTYLYPYKKRQAYNRSAELTLYLDAQWTGEGVGDEVMFFMESEAKKVQLKNLLGVICFENKASIALFKKHGYQLCAHFKNIGEKFNRILDVVIYQKEL